MDSRKLTKIILKDGWYEVGVVDGQQYPKASRA